MKVCRRTPLNAGLAGVGGVGRSVHRALTAPTPAVTPVQPRRVCPAAGVVRTVCHPLGLHRLVWRLAWMWEWKKSRKADEIGSSSSCRPVSECCFVLLGVGPSKAAASCPVWPWVLCGLAVTWEVSEEPPEQSGRPRACEGWWGDTQGWEHVCACACMRVRGCSVERCFILSLKGWQSTFQLSHLIVTAACEVANTVLILHETD